MHCVGDARIVGDAVAAIGLHASGRAPLTSQRNARLQAVTPVAAVDCPNAKPVAPAAPIVQQDASRTAVIEHDEVRITVVVEVAGGGAACDL